MATRKRTSLCGTYVAICAACAYEQYFLKQADANAAQQMHARINPMHEVRVTKVRQGSNAPLQEHRPTLDVWVWAQAPKGA